MAARPPGRTAHLGQTQAPRLQRRSGAIPTGISSHSLRAGRGLPWAPSPDAFPNLPSPPGRSAGLGGAGGHPTGLISPPPQRIP